MNKNNNQFICKYYSPSDNNLDSLRNKYFWFSKREFLNDPFDLGFSKNSIKVLEKYNFLNTLSEKPSEYAVCCFARDSLNRLMWAYYAQNYSGWCLIFRRGRLKVRQKAPMLSVRYVDEIDEDNPFLNSFNSCINAIYPEDIVRKILCLKHSSWSHEQEERIVIKIFKEDSKGAKRKWGTYELDHIIIGHKITEAIKKQILKLARDMNVPVYMTQANLESFQLIKIKYNYSL